MNRRHFIKLVALAGATVGCAKELFSKPAVGSPAQHFFAGQEFDKAVKALVSAEPVKPIFKITPIDNTIGLEGLPHSIEPNDDGYLCFEERFCTHTQRNADQYAIYAPMHGFERTGPWYLLRVISRREARQARFTIAVPKYATIDLVPKMVPGVIDLPQPEPGQTYWRIHGPNYVERDGYYVSRPATILIDIPESARI
jgi:hypothetical protein